MNHDDVVGMSMFWVGALFALTPFLVVGVVVATVWWGRRKQRREKQTPEHVG